MPLALTVSDAGDGTGAATVTGSASGSTNTLYRSAWDGQSGALAWTLHGTRTADGTIAIAVTGLFFWRLDNLAAGVTTTAPGYYQPIIDPDDASIHNIILDAVKAKILALSLTGIQSTRLLKRWIPRVWEEADNTPSCIIAPPGREQMIGMLNNKDDVGYPVVVCFLDKLNQDVTKNMERDLLWRQRVSRAFREQRIPGAPLVYKTIVEPDAIVDPTAYQNGYLASLMILRAVTRETRGV